MRPRRLSLVLSALVLLAPTPALAHGEELLWVFFLVPPMIVPSLLLVTVWWWKATAGAKLLSVAAVVLASVTTFVAFIATLRYTAQFPFVQLVLQFAQLAVPIAVWIVCWRRTKRPVVTPGR